MVGGNALGHRLDSLKPIPGVAADAVPLHQQQPSRLQSPARRKTAGSVRSGPELGRCCRGLDGTATARFRFTLLQVALFKIVPDASPGFQRQQVAGAGVLHIGRAQTPLVPAAPRAQGGKRLRRRSRFGQTMARPAAIPLHQAATLFHLFWAEACRRGVVHGRGVAALLLQKQNEALPLGGRKLVAGHPGLGIAALRVLQPASEKPRRALGCHVIQLSAGEKPPVPLPLVAVARQAAQGEKEPSALPSRRGRGLAAAGLFVSGGLPELILRSGAGLRCRGGSP